MSKLAPLSLMSWSTQTTIKRNHKCVKKQGRIPNINLYSIVNKNKNGALPFQLNSLNLHFQTGQAQLVLKDHLRQAHSYLAAFQTSYHTLRLHKYLVSFKELYTTNSRISLAQTLISTTEQTYSSILALDCRHAQQQSPQQQEIKFKQSFLAIQST